MKILPTHIKHIGFRYRSTTSASYSCPKKNDLYIRVCENSIFLDRSNVIFRPRFLCTKVRSLLKYWISSTVELFLLLKSLPNVWPSDKRYIEFVLTFSWSRFSVKKKYIVYNVADSVMMLYSFGLWYYASQFRDICSDLFCLSIPHYYRLVSDIVFS